MNEKMKRWIILTLFLAETIASFAADPAAAADHRNKPDPDEKAGAVLPPLISQKYEYRDVCGCCEKDIQCDMMQKAIRWNDGNSYDSITKWKVKWDYGYNRGPDYCSAESFRITADIVIQLPRWVCMGNAPPQSLKHRWDAYIRNLTDHENGHREIVRQAVEELTRAVSRLPPARSCRELDREVYSLCRDRMEKLDQDQQNYDAATGHGSAGQPAFP